MSKIVVDTIESSGTTVTVSDNLDAGTNAVTAGSVTGLTATSLTSGTLAAARLPATGVDASSLTTGTLPDGVLNEDAWLQVVKATSASSSYGTTQDTWIEGGVTGTITPSSTDSRILVICNFNGYISQSGGDDRVISGGKYGIQRSVSGGTDTDDCLGNSLMHYPVTDVRSYGYLWGQWAFPVCIQGIDEPGSTSAITYKLQWNYVTHADGTSNMGISNSSQIILIELKG